MSAAESRSLPLAKLGILLSINAVEEATDAIAVTDTDGSPVYHNPAFIDRFGYEPADLVQLGGFHALLGEDDLGDAVLEEIRGGRRWTGEVEIKTQDGIVLPTLLRADSVRNDAGEIVAMIALCTDITDRKLAEILLKESEERYRGVVEDQTELIFRFSPEGKITFVNRAFSEYNRGDARSLINKELARLFPKNRVREIMAVLSRLSTEKPYETFELQTSAPDGEQQWHQWTVRALFDGADAVIEFQAVGRDVTEQKEAAEALRESEEQHRFLADHASDMIARLDHDASYLYVSRASERLFGYSPGELLNKNAFDFIHPDDAEKFKSQLDSFQGAENLITAEFRFCRKDGAYVWVETTMRRVKESARRVIEFVSATRDITPRKRQEEKRARRLRVEDALLKVSRLLISSRELNFDEVLEIIGSAVDAHQVALYQIRGANAQAQRLGCWVDPKHPTSRLAREEFLSNDREWLLKRLRQGFVVASLVDFKEKSTNGRHEQIDQPTALLIPALSEDNDLIGYIQFNTLRSGHVWPTEEIRILCVLGDLLASFFERKKYEKALRESEERYRTFVATISEAIWCFDLAKPLDCSLDPADQLEHIRQHAVLAECNEVFSQLMTEGPPERIKGKGLTDIFSCTPEEILRDFIASKYRVENGSYAINHAGRQQKHYIFNIVGMVQDGMLVRAWGSQVDITHQIELKKSMVSALEEQQQRIGHDLHDGVGPYLTGIRMLSERLADKLTAQGAPEHEQAQKIATLSHEAAQQVRQIYRGLTPLQLYREGLVMALQDICDSVNDLPDVNCFFGRNEEIDIYDNKVKVHLFRIAQEAVNNALKHGEPANIWISLTSEGDQYCLQVRDDGIGFDTAETTGTTLGLAGMTFRARMLNADLRIESKRNDGTTIRCTVSGTSANVNNAYEHHEHTI